MNAKRILDISEAAGMLQCSVARVRQMVIGDQTLAAVHENYRGFRAPFELRGLRVFDVDDQGAITDVLRKKPAGWLRLDLAEVVRTMTERAHIEAITLPLSDLTPTAPPVPVTDKKWISEKLAELKAYREGHTMPETAVKFGISKQRIRQLLPRGTTKANPFTGLIRSSK